MAGIPLEDNFSDILGKAQRGQRLPDDDLARRAGVSAPELAQVKAGTVIEGALRKLARPLGLGEAALVESAKRSWYPRPVQIEGLAQFNTAWEDMTVNCYVAWDPASKEAAVFDTGASADSALDFVKNQRLKVKFIFLTHTHADHIADLNRLKKETGAPAFVGEREPNPGAEPFAEGRVFRLGGLTIEARRTSGHAVGGITYVLSGLARPVAVVGDALFAGSMGGGSVSYPEALETNRRNIFSLPDQTVLCPGHGPLTTVGEEKQHNPFYPEFHKTN